MIKKLLLKADFGQTFAFTGNQAWIAVPFILIASSVVSTFDHWSVLLPFSNKVVLASFAIVISVILYLFISRFLIAPVAGKLFEKRILSTYGPKTLDSAYSWLESEQESGFSFDEAAAHFDEKASGE